MECPVCTYNFDKFEKVPRILQKCGHTICAKCLANLEIGQTITCPFCKEIYPTSQSEKGAGNAQQFPINYFILNLLEECSNPVLQSQQKGAPYTTGPSHNSSMGSSLFSELVAKPGDASDQFCSLHPDKQVEFLCKEEDVYLCKKCLSKHKNHDLLILEDYVESTQASLCKQLAAFQEQGELLSRLLSQFNYRQQQFQMQINQNIQSTEAAFNWAVKQLLAFKEQVIAKYFELVTPHEVYLKQKITRLNSCFKQLQQSIASLKLREKEVQSRHQSWVHRQYAASDPQRRDDQLESFAATWSKEMAEEFNIAAQAGQPSPATLRAILEQIISQEQAARAHVFRIQTNPQVFESQILSEFIKLAREQEEGQQQALSANRSSVQLAKEPQTAKKGLIKQHNSARDPGPAEVVDPLLKKVKTEDTSLPLLSQEQFYADSELHQQTTNNDQWSTNYSSNQNLLQFAQPLQNADSRSFCTLAAGREITQTAGQASSQALDSRAGGSSEGVPARLPDEAKDGLEQSVQMQVEGL